MKKRSLRSALLLSGLLLCLSITPAKAYDDSEQNDQDARASAVTRMETRLTAIEDQMRSLTGKMEEIDYAQRRIEKTIERLQTDYDARLTKIEQTPAPQPTPTIQQPAQAQNKAAVSGTLGNMNLRDGEITNATLAPKAPALPETPDDYGLTIQEQYDRAFGLLRQADYDAAEKALDTFIKKNPKDKLSDNAKYWYAETFYVRGRFSEAAVSFADAFEQDSKGSKAPDSLLKLALSLAAIDKTDDACHTLNALKTKYPKAPAAIQSRTAQEVKRLKCK